MRPIQRVTAPTIDVLNVLLGSSAPVWGLLIIKQTGRLPGTVYPVLERLERQVWVTALWEEDASRPGPRRKLYRFTVDGEKAAKDVCDAFAKKNQKSPTTGAGRLVTP